ncbi:MAG: MCE family protein [Thermoanaerobaculia bacterium]|jgi:phospholipid/cholesterol/gamma-HCH transport system substrate-binding protein|nr:MCE family protein [Thermoanaerobaculia bacterium]
MTNTSQVVKVGIFMTACLVLLGWLILRVEDWRLWGPKGTRVDAVFDSIVGLDDKAAVRLAGVRVGRVDGIRLEGRRARVSLLLDQPIAFVEGSYAVIANQGLLGDKFIELRLGAEGAALLPADAVLPGKTPVSFDDAMAKIDGIADSIQGFFGGGAGAGGPGGAGGTGGAGGGISVLIESVRATSDELRALIAENRANVSGTMANFERFSETLARELPRITEQIAHVLAQMEGVLAENRGTLKDSMANIKDLTERVQTSVDNLNVITTKIASGEGTIGKLVASPEAHDQLMSALGSVEEGVSALGDTLGRVNDLELHLGLDGAYLSELEDWRSAFRIDVMPHGEESPRFYRVELVTDPRGRIYEKREIVTVTLPDGSTATTTTDRLTSDTERANWSALFGFPFAERRGSLWAGVIENSAGVQVDYSFFEKRAALSFEAFDFGRERDLDPHLRLTGQWNFLRNLYVKAGYDDPLVEEFRSPFVGVGIRWSDDDLKYLMGSVPGF